MSKNSQNSQNSKNDKMNHVTVVFRDTVSRRGKKPKFKYSYATTGRTVSDKRIKEIEKTYIPHTWDEVEIYSNHPRLIATGVLKDQLRYLYKKEYTDNQSKIKYRRMYSFGRKLDDIKKDIVNRLSVSKASKNKVIATALWLLTMSYIRVGNEKYLKENNTHGLLTLHKDHVVIKSDSISLDFVGKKKVQNHYKVHIPNSRFKSWLKTLHKEANPFFFQYKGRRITSADLNQYIQENYGPFTAKDFRTWGANIEFLKQIKQIDLKSLTNKRECQKNLKTCILEVSNKLNNTIAVCKSNYICKAILNEFQDKPQDFIKKAKKSHSTHSLLIGLLKELTH